jgi:uncharacterized protein (TIGR03067 family)
MTRLVVAVIFGLLVAAHSSGQENVKSDKDQLQGYWQGVTTEWKGKPMPDAEKLMLMIEHDTLVTKLGDTVMFKGKFTLDPSKKPRTLNLEYMEDSGDVKKGQVQHGICVIDGDTLKWCMGAPGVEARPKEFSTNDKQNHMLIVAKRSKK